MATWKDHETENKHKNVNSKTNISRNQTRTNQIRLELICTIFLKDRNQFARKLYYEIVFKVIVLLSL